MFDVFNIDMWKFKMSAYLKALGLRVYVATIKKSYFDNYKYIEANAQAMEALKHTLSKGNLSLISHCDSSFAVWNTLTSPEQQTTNIVKREAIVDESDEACSLGEVNVFHIAKVKSQWEIKEKCSLFNVCFSASMACALASIYLLLSK